MKKFIVLAIACALMCSVAIANATEFKVKGQFDLTVENIDNGDFTSGSDSNGVDIKERFRTQIDIIASENVSGVVYFEIGDITWGQGGSVGRGSGGALGADGVNIETRRAFIDFVVPTTTVKVRAGLQGLILPNAVYGSPVFDDDVAAVVVNYKENNFGLTTFFARPFSQEDETKKELKKDADGNLVNPLEYEYVDYKKASVDMFGLIGSYEGANFTVSPYVVYARSNENISFEVGAQNAADVVKALKLGKDDFSALWLGTSATFKPMANLDLGADLIYSSAEAGDDLDGFFVAGKAAYTFDVAVAELGGWYSTGVDGDDGFMPLAGAFTPTTFGFDGNTGRSKADVISVDGVGTAGIAFTVKDVIFIENVDHLVTVAYIGYTDDSRDDDAAVEFDFVTNWQMYENLSTTLELAYIAADFDSKVGTSEREDEDAFKAALSFKYDF